MTSRVESLLVSLLLLSNVFSVTTILLLVRDLGQREGSRMRVGVTELGYWKSEHSEQSCEDAMAWDTRLGLFVVADGAGTASFADIWSRILTRHFVTTPLLSGDPFEVEWWLSGAQEEYRRRVTPPDELAPAYREKARAGSHATLAALRVQEEPGASVKASVLTIGDACVFHLRAHHPLWSFPLRTSGEFTSAPVCLPTQNFRRSFHTLQSHGLNLVPGDLVVLATDAVAEWILAGRDDPARGAEQRLREVARVKPGEEWRELIETERVNGGLHDDDSSAIVITVLDGDSTAGELLGATASLDPATRELRRERLEKARDAGDNLRLAPLVGDPSCWAHGVDLGLSAPEIRKAQKVADAFTRVLDAVRANLDQPENVRSVWEGYASLLIDEPGAQQLVSTLRALGVERGRDRQEEPPEATAESSPKLGRTDAAANRGAEGVDDPQGASDSGKRAR